MIFFIFTKILNTLARSGYFELVSYEEVGKRKDWLFIYRIIEFYNRRKFSKTSPSSISAQDISDKMQNVISQNIFLKIAKNVINYFLKITNSGSSIKGLYQKVESKK